MQRNRNSAIWIKLTETWSIFSLLCTFCSITGQKYQKLVWMEVFFGHLSCCNFQYTQKKKSRKQTSMERKLWDFAAGLLAAHSCQLVCCSPLQSSSYNERGFFLQVPRLGWKEPVWSHRLHQGSYGTLHSTSSQCPGAKLIMMWPAQHPCWWWLHSSFSYQQDDTKLPSKTFNNNGYL